MNTLALDIGTNTGFAVLKTDDPHFSLSGTWLLADQDALKEARKEGIERRLDIRFRELFRIVGEAIDEFNITRIIFEDVQFQSSQAQTQLWSRLTGAVWGAALSAPHEIEVQCVPVGTLKQFATNHGGADKCMMADALKLKYPQLFHLRTEENPDYNPKKKRSKPRINVLKKLSTNTDMDDNEVDAIWLSEYGRAVDRGDRSFKSIWENKKEAAKKKREKLKLAKLKKKQVLSP